MGNLTTGIRKFLQNKNTVTVVGVILAIFILYFAYTMRIKSSINPINVPYAAEQIPAGTQITEGMISTRQVPPSMLEGDVITNMGEIVDKYSAVDVVIPKGSLFYKRAVVEKEQLPTNIILQYPKGYVLYNLSVDTASTYGNSVYPGNYIDIYLKAVNKINDNDPNALTRDADKIMLGKLLANIEVLAVKDSSGKAVFQNIDENRTPAMVVFALPEEYYILLKKAEFMRSYDTSLILVPTNESLKDEPAELEISSDQLKEWINRNTVWTEN
jgi:Flp pilus assembly protein CpaB